MTGDVLAKKWQVGSRKNRRVNGKIDIFLAHQPPFEAFSPYSLGKCHLV